LSYFDENWYNKEKKFIEALEIIFIGEKKKMEVRMYMMVDSASYQTPALVCME